MLYTGEVDEGGRATHCTFSLGGLMGFFSVNASHVWALATSQLTKTVSEKMKISYDQLGYIDIEVVIAITTATAKTTASTPTVLK